MMKIGVLEVSNTLGNMLLNNLQVDETKPYTFLLDNKGLTWGIHYQATNKIEQIKKWADKVGATLEVKGLQFNKVEIEISDPIATNLEKVLENY